MKVRLWPMYLQKSLSIFLVEEKCQVKLQDIRFKFVSYWVVTKYFVRINVPAWSHFSSCILLLQGFLPDVF